MQYAHLTPPQHPRNTSSPTAAAVASPQQPYSGSSSRGASAVPVAGSQQQRSGVSARPPYEPEPYAVPRRGSGLMPPQAPPSPALAPQQPQQQYMMFHLFGHPGEAAFNFKAAGTGLASSAAPPSPVSASVSARVPACPVPASPVSASVSARVPASPVSAWGQLPKASPPGPSPGPPSPPLVNHLALKPHRHCHSAQPSSGPATPPLAPSALTSASPLHTSRAAGVASQRPGASPSPGLRNRPASARSSVWTGGGSGNYSQRERSWPAQGVAALLALAEGCSSPPTTQSEESSELKLCRVSGGGGGAGGGTTRSRPLSALPSSSSAGALSAHSGCPGVYMWWGRGGLPTFLQHTCMGTSLTYLPSFSTLVWARHSFTRLLTCPPHPIPLPPPSIPSPSPPPPTDPPIHLPTPHHHRSGSKVRGLRFLESSRQLMAASRAYMQPVFMVDSTVR